MTTMTFNDVTVAHEGSVAERVLNVMSRVIVAAVPFAAIAWMFVSR